MADLPLRRADRRDRQGKLHIAQGGTFDLTRVAYWGPNTGKVNDAISKALERVYLGDQTVEEAFAQAQDEAQAALDEVAAQ